MRDKEAKNIYPVTKSDLVSRPGGGDVEAALEALEGGRGLRPLFEARGAVYNAETGFYELNGLTDITEKQMLTIFAFCAMYGYGGTNTFSRYMGDYHGVRTNLPLAGYGVKANDLYAMGDSGNFETLCFIPLFEYVSNGITSTRYPLIVEGNAILGSSCKKLHHVYGCIRAVNLSTNIFSYCPLLESVNVKLEGDTGFSFCEHSPLLGIDSFRFLVENAANTKAVTLTINAEILSKMQDAEGHPEWHALMQQAAEKQISFATE